MNDEGTKHIEITQLMRKPNNWSHRKTTRSPLAVSGSPKRWAAQTTFIYVSGFLKFLRASEQAIPCSQQSISTTESPLITFNEPS